MPYQQGIPILSQLKITLLITFPFKPLHIMKKLFNILTEPFIQASSREKLFTILYTFAILLICILASAI